MATFLFQSSVGEYLSILTAGKRTETYASFAERYQSVWGITPPKDERTAEQIISDTLKKHGITLKKES